MNTAIRDAVAALRVNPAAVDDAIAIADDEWALWMHGSPDPVCGHADDGELYEPDADDLECIERLVWWREVSGVCAPGGSLSLGVVRGLDVTVEIRRSPVTDRYGLHWSVLDGVYGDGVPGGCDIVGAVEGELDEIFNCAEAEEVWDMALEL